MWWDEYLCKAAFDYNTGRGRIPFLLRVKPRGPVKIWPQAAFGPRAGLWTVINYKNVVAFFIF